ncbi:MAG TPA: methylated-DNA--[protein]-cysteine S-methyltransferase [Isosphaeraceae bacterium]|nr:methylated-DNA--[protein]-cysteine S-methyltransferase [Isosphaeraceae bacterium]
MNESAFFSYYSSPVGELLLTSNGEALTGLHLPRSDGSPAPLSDPRSPRQDSAFREVRRQLDAYFAGERRAFDLPLLTGGTPFQRLAWEELARIPYGTTISYAEQARRIGRPGASRAVGAANGRNPIAIILPCHRVIGSDGTLTGYGGGLDLKAWLLWHEATMLGDKKRSSSTTVRGKLQPVT